MPSTSKDQATVVKTRRSIRRLVFIFLAGLLIGLWLVNTPNGLLGKADAIGYAVCHRIDGRSFHLGERALPLCARCLGMFLGALLTLTYYFIRRPRHGLYPARSLSFVLVIFGLIWAVDGLNSYLHLFPNAPHLYSPSNTLRMITGMLIGISLATLVFPLFNQVAWRDWRPEPVLRSVGDLAKIGFLSIPVAVAALSDNPLLLYPLALLSGLAVLIILTLVYATPILTVLRKENQADSWRDLLWPLLGGLTLAMAQIALLDWIRYRLTGTWGGFQL